MLRFVIMMSLNEDTYIHTYTYIIEGRMEGKMKRGRLRMMLPEWMMKEDYSKLKERRGHRGGGWLHWTCEPA